MFNAENMSYKYRRIIPRKLNEGWSSFKKERRYITVLYNYTNYINGVQPPPPKKTHQVYTIPYFWSEED